MDTSYNNNDEIFEANDPIVEPKDYLKDYLLPDGSEDFEHTLFRASPEKVYEVYKSLAIQTWYLSFEGYAQILTNNGDADGFDHGSCDLMDIMEGKKPQDHPMPPDPAPDMDLSELISSLKAGYSPENQPTQADFQKIYEKAYFYGYYEASLK